MSRLLRELQGLVLRNYWREVLFSYGTLRWPDCSAILRAAADALRGRYDAVGAPDLAAYERAFASFLGVTQAFAFGGSRQAFYSILKALEVGPGDEVLVTGFTCYVVPHAVVLCGATPRYVDIDPKTYNLDPACLEAAITPATRVLLVQHTFGFPVDWEPILSVARKHGLRIIEDCAHTLGGAWKGRLLGTLGDAAFFSTELTKPINTGWGGIAVANSLEVAAALRRVYESTPAPSRSRCFQSALQLFGSWCLYAPNIYGLGKFGLALLYRLGIFSASIGRRERLGERPPGYPSRLSALQARVGLSQLQQVETQNVRRLQIASIYTRACQQYGLATPPQSQEAPLLRFTLRVPDRDQCVKFFRRHQIELGVWFNAPIHPDGCSIESIGYQRGSCPVAEEVATQCVNLPMHPTMSDADVDRVVKVLARYLSAPRNAALR